MKFHYIIDVSGCSNDWGIVLTSQINNCKAADIDADFTMICPEAFIKNNTLTFLSYAIMDAATKGVFQAMYIPEIANSELYVIAMLGTIFQQFKANPEKYKFDEHRFILMRAPNSSLSLNKVDNLKKAFGLPDLDIIIKSICAGGSEN